MSSPARPRLLIEDWLPANAIGVECMRERGSASALAPHTFLHVWWARRPLTVSRAAVLGSLLPADFDRATFERLLGFGRPGEELVTVRALMDTGVQVKGGFNCGRAFSNPLDPSDLTKAHAVAREVWGDDIRLIDPMAGGGSIPLEAARMGFDVIANEYNPVACSILEATVDYPFRFGPELADKARKWGKVWEERVAERLEAFYPKEHYALVHAYLYARTVPCPDTGHPTPLVPDWHLLKPKSGVPLAAEPVPASAVGRMCRCAGAQGSRWAGERVSRGAGERVSRGAGEQVSNGAGVQLYASHQPDCPHVGNGLWTIRVREVGKGAGQLRQPPAPTYGRGNATSLFTGTPIPGDYIKAMAQGTPGVPQGKLGSQLYAIATKATTKLNFRAPEQTDLEALAAAETELQRLRPGWERGNVIPTEGIPEGEKTKEPLRVGHTTWASLFFPRQLLALGVLVEELRELREEIVETEGQEVGEAVGHLLAVVLDKSANHCSYLASWHAPRQVMRSVFDRHDFSFKPTHAEMAPCVAGGGLAWAIANVLDAYGKLAKLPRSEAAAPATITKGSATSLWEVEDGSLAAVVVDPPYADNVQYSELADFFYVWLKRTQGHRRPEWFSTYLCEHDEEAVVNVARVRSGEGLGQTDWSDPTDPTDPTDATPRQRAQAFYQRLMGDVFAECHRVLRDDGVLTVMFTHKQQSAWAALFESLIAAGFTITATWPVQTESQHSLHQAQKNAAQSTVLLASRKRVGGGADGRGSEVGYFDEAMQAAIREAAQRAAARMREQGLNAVDQLVGAFGPAMEVFTRYAEVRTDTGEVVRVEQAIQVAADAVIDWRVEQLAARGLDDVDAESRFALLCWDVLGAAEFRFNEAMLLGRSVGMDVQALKDAGLVKTSGDKVTLLSAKERRRDRALRDEQVSMGADVQVGWGAAGQGSGSSAHPPTRSPARKRTRTSARKVHPNDHAFHTALDACHALALKYAEGGGEQAGIGAARGLARQQGWTAESPCGKLMTALVHAAPEAVRLPGDSKTAAVDFPEFRAWHALLQPLFGAEPPTWEKKKPAQLAMLEE